MTPSPGNIWNFAQNKPSLVVADLEVYGVPPDVVYDSLLKRGVFKWLAVRRMLISLKDVWRDRLSWAYTIDRSGLSKEDRAWIKGYQKATELCRAEVRALCHSERWVAPDFDNGALEYLRAKESTAQ